MVLDAHPDRVFASERRAYRAGWEAAVVHAAYIAAQAGEESVARLIHAMPNPPEPTRRGQLGEAPYAGTMFWLGVEGDQ